MEEDFAEVCAEAPFIGQQRNSIVRIDKLNEDRIAREVLDLLGIKYKVDAKDNHKIANKLERFKHIPVYDSIKMDFITAENQKTKIAAEIR